MTDQEINEAVARKLGYTPDPVMWGPKPENKFWRIGKCLPIPAQDYCHSIEAAWEIVEILSKKKLEPVILHTVGSGWSFNVLNRPSSHDDDDFTEQVNVDKNKSAPMAICLAFLKLP